MNGTAPRLADKGEAAPVGENRIDKSSPAAPVPQAARVTAKHRAKIREKNFFMVFLLVESGSKCFAVYQAD